MINSDRVQIRYLYVCLVNYIQGLRIEMRAKLRMECTDPIYSVLGN